MSHGLSLPKRDVNDAHNISHMRSAGTGDGLRPTLFSSENRAFMPAAGGAAEAACFGTSLIRLPRPPDGMGGGGAGAPRLAAGGAVAGAELVAPAR